MGNAKQRFHGPII